MITCGDLGSSGSWVISIDENLEIVKQDCFLGYHGILNAKDVGGCYYFYGKKPFPSTGKAGMLAVRTDRNLDIIWERSLGCEEHFFPYTVYGVATDDGGVVCSTSKAEWACGDVSQCYGGLDAWVVKLDKSGEMEWEISIGTEGREDNPHLFLAKDGGLLVLCGASLSGVNGTIENCARPDGYADGLIVKLDAQGTVEWSRCYGGFYDDYINEVIELSDGYLFGGAASSTDGDLQDAGYHPGHWHGQPWMLLTADAWLLRTDLEGNVLWSKCYGGTKNETIIKVFENEDSGFTVFGATMSLDGDSQSANNLKPAYNLEIGYKLWVFRTDSNGNLLWERAIGTKTESHEYLIDVIKHNDREYTILAESGCSNGEIEMPCGDYNCTNDTAYLLHSYTNYWVLHVTDTVDYSMIGIAEHPLSQEKAVQVYPNPSNNTVRVVLPKEALVREAKVYNVLGQLVKAMHNTNEISVAGLLEGIYLLHITDENKKRHTVHMSVGR